MIRNARAFAWLRWKLLRNSVRAGSRDTGERLSRVAQIVVPIFLFVLVVPSMIGLGALGYFAGTLVAEGGAPADTVLVITRIMLLVLTGMVVAWPIIRSAAGSSPNLTRLLLLPLSRRALHTNEMLSGISDPWIAVFLPGLFLLGAGMAAGGALPAATIAVAAAAGLAWVLLALASCSAFAIHLLLRNRRRAEMFILLMMLLISVAGMLPALVMDRDEPDRRSRRERRETAAPQEPGTDEAAAGPGEARKRGSRLELPRWMAPLPSELYARSIRAGAEGGVTRALVPLAALLLQAALAHALSFAIYRRLLETPEGGGAARQGSGRPVRSVRIPGMSDAASAVALIQARTYARTVKGKMNIYFGPIIGVLIGFMLWRRTDLFERTDMTLGPGVILCGMITAVLLLGLQPVLLNLFATDGAGLTLEFLGPVSARDLVVGKLAACAFLGGAPLLLFLGLAAAVFPSGSPFLWLAVPPGAAATFLILAPVAAILSAMFPRVSNLNSLGKAGNPHAAAGLLGTVTTAVALAIPAGLTLVAALLLRKPWLAPVLTGAWCAVAAGIAWLLTGLAAGILEERRENLALVAQGR